MNCFEFPPVERDSAPYPEALAKIMYACGHIDRWSVSASYFEALPPREVDVWR